MCPYGKPVKLKTDLKGFPDGRLLVFEIYRKDNRGEEIIDWEVGATKGDKAIGWWNPDFGEHTVELKKSGTGGPVSEKYYFVAKIFDYVSNSLLEVKSEEFEFTFPLVVHVKDEKGPLNNVEYKITFSDGKSENGKFSGGFAKLRAPLGKFDIEVKGYSPSTLYEEVRRGTTTAFGTVSQQVYFNVKLFLRGRILQPDSMVAVEKLKPGAGEEYEKVKGNENLLNIQTNGLRLIIEDNAANGEPEPYKSWPSRGDFYSDKKLVDLLNVFVRLCVVVRKFEGQAQVAMPLGKDEVEAAFEVVDPSEDIAHINGPRPGARTGRQFVENFVNKVTGAAGADNDNCVRDFAVPPYDGRCRVQGDRVAASDVLYHYSRLSRSLQPLPKDPSDQKLGKIGISRARDSKGKPVGITNVFFHPPPILGDNYKLKVTIKNMEGRSMPLKDDNGAECGDFQTPTITVWKKVKIHMIVYQESVVAKEKAIRWKEVEKAYGDAFIEVEKPPQGRIIKISMKEWMGYLDKFVYGRHNTVKNGLNWRRDPWKIYKSADNAARHSTDFGKYSFPQDCVYEYKIRSGDVLHRIARWFGLLLEELYLYDGGTGRNNWDRLNDQKKAKGRGHAVDNPNLIYPGDIVLVPMNLNPSDDADPTSWDLFGLLALRILKDKLGKSNWNKLMNPLSGKRFGLCVLLCKPPRPKSAVGGQHTGGKIFYMVEQGDVTATFIHEMGHALFLNHGSTGFLYGTQNPAAPVIQTDSCWVVRQESGGSEGPYFDEHCSEDMISCIMSYCNDLYDSDGKPLGDTDHPDHSKLYDHPTDWHFCGVCLLSLRFYDVKKMLDANDKIFKQLQYNKKPQIASITGATGDVYHIDVSGRLSIPQGTRQTLLARYPQEGVLNNRGKDFYKDTSFLSTTQICGGIPRAEWDSTDQNKAIVVPEKIGDYWFSRLVANNKGATSITFTVAYGPNAGDVVKSDPLKVTVT